MSEPTTDRAAWLEQVRERLHHEPCCDHSGRDEHGCWDCRNTGCAHAPYAEDQADEDMEAMLRALEAVERVTEEWIRLHPAHDRTPYAEGALTGLIMIREAIDRARSGA